ncbi:MAG: lysostaphin resistance A-like protein [Halanaeroarchaeum sp.]
MTLRLRYSHSPESANRNVWWKLDSTAIREASWATLVLVVALGGTAATITNLNRADIFALTAPVFDASGGFVQPTLVINLALLVVIVGGVILWFGGLRQRDIGLVSNRIPFGVAVTLGTWLLMQLTGAGVLLVRGEPLGPAESWFVIGVLPILGGFLAQILGNALFEEVVYRAFLLPQIAMKLDRSLADVSSRMVFALALIGSQGIFAVIHVPARLVEGAAPGTLPFLIIGPFLIGTLLGLVYYRTGNLFVTIGLHALINDPVLLVNGGAITLVPLVVVTLGVILLGPSIDRRFDRHGLVPLRDVD